MSSIQPSRTTRLSLSIALLKDALLAEPSSQSLKSMLPASLPLHHSKLLITFSSRASNVDGIKDSVYFIKYNVDEIIEISKMLKLRQTPSFVAFKDGERVDQLVGGDDPTALKAFIKGIAA